MNRWTTCLALALCGSVALAADTQRPPSVPLIACDPYFSVWSPYDKLTDGPTAHWTNRNSTGERRPQPLTSMVRIDGHTFRLMGDKPSDVPAANQVGLTVLPTRTIYEFEQAGVHLSLTFMTPLLPDDLMVASRPLTYLTWSAKSTSSEQHDVSLYIDASPLLAVNKGDQNVTFEGGNVGELKTLRVGTVEQPVLEVTGDDQRIDWGYFYLAGNTNSASILPADTARDAFAKGDELPKVKIENDVDAKSAAVLAMILPLGKISEEKSSHVLLAYDDLYSIRYFSNDLKGYWTKDGAKIGDLLQTAEKEYKTLDERSHKFDDELMADMQKLGGNSFQQIGVLAYRQSLAAQKISADANGQPIMFSKENFSNGCLGTVDVLYPAAPLMMAFSPNMLKASLRPLMDYSASSRWKHNSAPHDMGQYPHATGQVYGGGDSDSGMPVEETGNMLCMLAALSKAEGNAKFSEPYWPTLTKWANYLVDNGFDPGNQLTTDDFAGHIARNTNLSAKAIMGVASYAMIADQLGKKDEATKYMKIAKDAVGPWMKKAADGDHYGLVFEKKGTWSQKYNLVWDTILGFNIFPKEVREKELAFYMTKMNKYGLPLDSRKEYTKLDWEVWTATLADKHEDAQKIYDAAALWANETPDRAPLGDWYQTVNGHKEGFQARSVVGGVFIPFMTDSELWKKYASRDKTQLSNWAPVDFNAPKMKVLLPAADGGEAATWSYTFDQPSEDWFKADFDAGKWKKGKAGFGGGGAPGTHVGTSWSSDDIWIRRTFTLPEVNTNNLRLWMHHDEEAEVYINGVLAAKPGGFTAEYKLIRLRDDAKAAIKAGKNTIAIHCHQTIGGQYVDAGLAEVATKK